MQQPITNPTVPYVGPIQGGFTPGSMIRVQGQVPPTADRFDINLHCGPPPSDTALHLSVRLLQNYVARNSMEGGAWGTEEDSGALPITPGQNFEILVLCDPSSYKIAVNGDHFAEFRHRIPLQQVSHLAVNGDVNVRLIAFESGGGTPSAPPRAGGPDYAYGPPPGQYGPPNQYGPPPGQYGAPQGPYGQGPYGQGPYGGGPPKPKPIPGAPAVSAPVASMPKSSSTQLPSMNMPMPTSVPLPPASMPMPSAAPLPPLPHMPPKRSNCLPPSYGPPPYAAPPSYVPPPSYPMRPMAPPPYPSQPMAPPSYPTHPIAPPSYPTHPMMPPAYPVQGYQAYGVPVYPQKKVKKSKLKKAMKYGLPIAGVGLGAYALSQAVHHHSSSSSSSSSDSD